MVALAIFGGCAPLVCPAIGYLNTVTVIVSDPEIVELVCLEGCEGGLNDPYREGPNWQFDAPERPASITVAGYDEAGAEVLREDVSLDWTVADPGNACGSSASAGPVTLAP
ncbi:MAG: hypothetical protein WBL06_10840 [Pseudolysinimonas sp.]|jgi:hypothetical protein|uniref:hypothetical protein n=1 Tax=Pseudolysinimonas sp. TaxID=2680009 RepID=UPI003C73AAFC